MTTPHQPVSAEESAAILRLHHVESWPVGTIASQLGRHCRARARAQRPVRHEADDPQSPRRSSGLLQLLDRIGPDLLERAVSEVVARDQLQLRAVHLRDRPTPLQAGLAPPLTVPLTAGVRANAVVRPHALSTYDRLHAEEGGSDEEG